MCLFSLQVNAAEILTLPEDVGGLVQTEESAEKTAVSELDLGDYSAQMTVGEKQLLNVTVLPMEAESTEISYSSSNASIATINGMGRITALMTGSTVITVSAGGVTQSFTLQVAAEKDTKILVADIEVGEHESEVEVGKTLTLSGTVLPSDASDSIITYKSSNTAVATVNSTGEVKGISRGEAVITLSAGEFSKDIPITVKVATTGIVLNKDYLVLKPNDSYQLSAKITPVEAKQIITYRSADASIATVSQGGVVTARKTGSTTIIVSNGDTSVAVSVIVNKSVSCQELPVSREASSKEKTEYENCIYAEKQEMIDSEMLSYLYETKQVLKIIGKGYVIEIDGKDIVNSRNEFYTDIELKEADGKSTFILNQGKELCGAVTLYLKEPKGTYLYLYNVSKKKYEIIGVPDMDKLRLTTAGEYQLCKSKIQVDKRFLIYAVIGGVTVLLVGGIVYVVVKRRYWFW